MATRFQRKNKNVENYLFTYFMSKPQTMKILIDYKDCDLLEDRSKSIDTFLEDTKKLTSWSNQTV